MENLIFGRTSELPSGSARNLLGRGPGVQPDPPSGLNPDPHLMLNPGREKDVQEGRRGWPRPSGAAVQWLREETEVEANGAVMGGAGGLSGRPCPHTVVGKTGVNPGATPGAEFTHKRHVHNTLYV